MNLLSISPSKSQGKLFLTHSEVAAPKYFSRPQSKIKRIHTAKARYDQQQQPKPFNLLHRYSSNQLTLGNDHISKTFVRKKHSELDFETVNAEIQEEKRMKQEINIQLALNGFVRRQLIKTQAQNIQALKSVNPTMHAYASLADTKKYSSIKDEIQKEICIKGNTVRQTYTKRDSRHEQPKLLLDIQEENPLNIFKYRQRQMQSQAFSLNNDHKQLKASNGLIIVGGYREYLQDRFGNVYRNSTVGESTMVKPQEQPPTKIDPKPYSLEVVGNEVPVSFSTQNRKHIRPFTAKSQASQGTAFPKPRPKSAYSLKTSMTQQQSNDSRGVSRRSQNRRDLIHGTSHRSKSKKLSSPVKIQGWKTLSSFGNNVTQHEITPNNEDLEQLQFGM